MKEGTSVVLTSELIDLYRYEKIVQSNLVAILKENGEDDILYLPEEYLEEAAKKVDTAIKENWKLKSKLANIEIECQRLKEGMNLVKSTNEKPNRIILEKIMREEFSLFDLIKIKLKI